METQAPEGVIQDLIPGQAYDATDRQQLATFSLCEHTYGIDVARVQEVLKAQERTRVPLAPPTIAGLINLRGQVLMAVDLREQMQLPSRGEGDPEPMVVVIRTASEAIALLVDTIGAVVTVDQSRFETPPDTLDPKWRDLIKGAYKLDGSLLLALDVDKAIE